MHHAILLSKTKQNKMTTTTTKNNPFPECIYFIQDRSENSMKIWILSPMWNLWRCHVTSRGLHVHSAHIWEQLEGDSRLGQSMTAGATRHSFCHPSLTSPPSRQILWSTPPTHDGHFSVLGNVCMCSLYHLLNKLHHFAHFTCAST